MVLKQHDVAPPGIEDDIRDEAVMTIDYPSEPDHAGRSFAYAAPEMASQVMYQRCGGGRRIVRKRIGD